MLYRERLEELKLLSLSRKLRGVLILVCKYHQKDKLLGTKGLFNVRERRNKNQRLKPAKANCQGRWQGLFSLGEGQSHLSGGDVSAKLFCNQAHSMRISG